MQQNTFDLSPEMEAKQDQICLDYWTSAINREDALIALVNAGVDVEVAKEGLTEIDERKRCGLPMIPTVAELESLQQ